jgi:hypothetical protein
MAAQLVLVGMLFFAIIVIAQASVAITEYRDQTFTAANETFSVVVLIISVLVAALLLLVIYARSEYARGSWAERRMRRLMQIK